MEKPTLVLKLSLIEQGSSVTTVEAGKVPLLNFHSNILTVPIIINFLRAGCPGVQLLVSIRRPCSGGESEHKESFLEFKEDLELYLGSFALGEEDFAVVDNELIEFTNNGFQSQWMAEVGNKPE